MLASLPADRTVTSLITVHVWNMSWGLTP